MSLEMKFVDLERFRFLTGHGKQFALELDAALEDGDKETGGLVSQYIDRATSLVQHTVGAIDGFRGWKSGTLKVHFAPGYKTPFPPEYIVMDEDKFKEARIKDGARYGDGEFPESVFLITLVLWQSDRRIVTNVPAISLMRKRGALKESPFQVYNHRFLTDKSGEPIDGPSAYIGVTGRGWQERWLEHVRSARNGSHYKFHEAIRKYDEAQTVEHSVIGCFRTEAEAMDLEEKMVGYESLYPLGLNMIPGGYAGMRYLHKIGATRGQHVSPDDKQDIINRFFETASRKGIPNPLASVNWQNPEYAEKVICAGDDRLKPDQIRTARFLATVGKTSPEIASEIGARNVAQVDRLLAGETYSRVA